MKQETYSLHEGKTKSGVVAALIEMGYVKMPKALAGIEPKPFNRDEWDFARYLIFDDDFGAAWNDSEQINMQLLSVS